jgi:saccharopine dehydrogenase-like NADP-dependent oxidoreductase
VILAGRSAQSARRATERLSEELGEAHVERVPLDATGRPTVRDALAPCDLLVVCVPVPGVAEAALEAGTDCIDITLDPATVREVEALAPRVEASGR